MMFPLLKGAVALYRRGTGQVLNSAGVPIRYFDLGQGEPIVLIHGFTRSAAAWTLSGVAPALAQNHRVITLDSRGHGRSGKPIAPASYGARMADDVVRILDHLKIDSAHIVGHSLGGRITLYLAATQATRVKSATLIASGGMLASAGASDPMPIELVAESLEHNRSLHPLLQAIAPPTFRNSTWRLRLLNAAALATNDPLVLASIVRDYDSLSVTDAQLANLPLPVSAVIGSEDPYQLAVTALSHRLPGLKTTVVDSATHLNILRRPETLLAIKQSISAAPNKQRQAA